MFLQFLLFSFTVVQCRANIPATEEYPHHAVLDTYGKVILYWNFTETHITFEIHGNTTGWVGIGISPNGAMTGADIFVGWVKDGTVVITDRHGVANAFPPLDPEKNIELLDGMESDGWTVLKFRRQLASCEPNYDLPITSDTLKIIHAFGDEDPEGDDITPADYHYSNRGIKSLLLLEVSGGEDGNFPEGEAETHKSFDLLNENFEIPAETTYYNCRMHKIPEFSKKQHVVKVEPVIQAGNEMVVHHILVYQCLASVNESQNLGIDTRCFSSNMPPDYQSCNLVIQAWAIGGTAIYYPKHAGYPLGEADSPKYVVVETHYDNPRAISGMKDSSGLRFTYTNQLRQFDASIIQAGHVALGVSLLIPPNAESFLSTSECSAQCLEQGMAQGGVESLNIFGVILHSHLLATGITARHLRHAVELPYLAKDDAYDFNYQETRRLSEEREIVPGDSFQVICDYKSKGVRENMTVGGLDTVKEMCLAYFHYYPKIPLSFCQTGPNFNDLLNRFGVNSVKLTAPLNPAYNDIYDLQIVEPEMLAGKNYGEYLNEMVWDDETTELFETDLKNIMRSQTCRGLETIPGVDRNIPPPQIDVPYVEEEPVCFNFTSAETTTELAVSEKTDTSTVLIEDIDTTTGGLTKLYPCNWMYFLVCLIYVIALR